MLHNSEIALLRITYKFRVTRKYKLEYEVGFLRKRAKKP